MRLDPHAELAALWWFLAAPRRTLSAHSRSTSLGTHWSVRALFFAAAALMLNIVIEFGVLSPLADRASIASKLPQAVTLGWTLLALAFAPVVEELVFRAGLRQAGYTLFIGPALIALIAVPGRRPTLIVVAILLTLALAAWLLCRHVLFRRAGARFAAGRRFVVRYGWVFWSYAAAFALMHVGNYTWSGPRGALVVLLVAPQFVVGVVAGYVRIRDGLRASVLLHFASNAVAVALMAVLPP